MWKGVSASKGPLVGARIPMGGIAMAKGAET